jgi:[protein-PII] uridylyltransferase
MLTKTLSRVHDVAGALGDLVQVREQYRDGKTVLLASLADSGASSRGIHSLLKKLARHTDATLQALWLRADFPADFSLVAVGGYGRGELFPHSDVDVLLLLPNSTALDVETHSSGESLKTRIENFIGSCWDSGLEIGSSVRSLSECLEESAKDVTVQTSLLEARWLAGAKDNFNSLRQQLDAALDPQSFFVAKTLELRQRHNKFEDTPYALEPNCKESPGGLRDLQVVLWVARAAGLGKSWDELARNGLATPFEVRQIKSNEALLSLIRARLHVLSGRREDRLVFDLQTVVAESFGYLSQAPDGSRLPRRASESLMRRYYWAAKAVTQLNQILLLNIEERPNPNPQSLRPLNARFFEKAGRIEVASDDLYVREPHAILETFLIFQTTAGVNGLSARTLRALYNARGVMNAQFRRDPVNRDTFRQILQQDEGITHAMRLMNQTSVLGRYLWVFRQIV